MNGSGRIISEGFALPSRIYKNRLLLLIALFVFSICPCLYSEPVVKWWISSQDMKNKLSPQTDIIFAPGGKNPGFETELAAESVATLVWKPSDL